VGTTTTLAGALTYGGVTLSNAVTGTGNMVLSSGASIVSPTITGATITTASFNGTVGATTPSTGAFTTVTASSTINATGVLSAGAGGTSTVIGALQLNGGSSSGGGSLIYLYRNSVIQGYFGHRSAIDGSANNNLAIQSTAGIDLLPSSGSTGASITTAGIGFAAGNTVNWGFLSYQSGSTKNGFQAGNSNTGAGSTNGAFFGVDTTGNATIDYGSSLPLLFKATGTEVMRLTQAGNLCIGNTSTSYKCAISGILNVGTDAAGTGGNGQIVLNSANSTPTTSASPVIYHRQGIGLGLASDFAISFEVNGGTSRVEAARITPSSTSFLIGKTANGLSFAGFEANYSTGQTDVTVSGSECMNITRITSYGAVIRFFQTDAATICGSIATSAGATAYNTSSDYRLKENVQPMTGGLATVAALKPVTYDWIADQTAGEGFIAHELQAVIPRAVTGEKDALDKDGNMDPQGVDFSKIVPHLVAAVQELTARLTALENK
jgi:hypothetical protein